MGVLTVGNILERVQRQFGDEAGVLINITAVRDWINDAMREIILDNDLLKVRSTAVVAVGQPNYGLPSDVLRLHSLSYDGRPINEVSLSEARKTIDVDDTANYPRAVPQEYWVWGSEFFLYPAPSEAKQVTLYYNRNPTAVVNTTDVPELPARYDNRLVEYCIAQASELDDNDERAARKLNQFQEGLERARDEENSGGQYPHMGVSLADSSGYSMLDY